MTRAPSPILAMVATLAFVVAAIVGHAWTRPPAPLPISAPASAFSAMRARQHIEAIARAPHRMGSAEHARVRGYLVEQLKGLGLSPEIQEAVVSLPARGGARVARVQNVMARMRGSEGGKAVLLVAHYDTRSMTPGASDDGYGVAALLETLRALAADGPRPRDVIALFTDGEEEGLLGARAFVDRHAWAREVGVALNFEARGNAGAALMFQTSDESGALVDALARAVHAPAASSLSQAIYRRMPNDTDLTVFLTKTPAMNVANIGGFERYHAPTDTIDNVDLGTLQHHGDHALGLARTFAHGPLPPERAPDPTYFDLGPRLVRYPGAWTRPLAWGSAILLGIFVVAGSLRGSLRPASAIAGFFVAILVVVLAAISAGVLSALADALHPSYAAIHAARPLVSHLHLAAFSAIAIAFAIGAHGLLAPRVRASELFTGAAALLVALANVTAILLPGGAFLFTWPAIAALVVALPLVLRRDFEEGSALASAIAALAPLVAIAMLAPFVTQLVQAFGLAGAPAPAALVAILALLALPAWSSWTRQRRVVLPCFAIAIALYVGAGVVPPFDRAYPRPDTLLFAVDADERRAFWVSPDRAPDAWTDAVLSHATQRDALPLPFPLAEQARVLAAQVAFVEEPGPEIAWLEGENGATRVRVTPPPGAELLAVRIEGAMGAARVEGERVWGDGRGLTIRFYAPPATGIVIDLTNAETSPLTVRALSQRPGFPDKASPQPGARPAGLMARPGMMPPWDDLLESDMTLVLRTSRR
jgi:hypothetical protein